MPACLSFHDLTLGYERHPAVHHLSGEIQTGDLLAICGPNGAGKSTLLKGICGSLRPLGGKVDRHGLSTHDIAYLPQSAEIDRSFPIHVYDLVSMGLWRRAGLFGGIGKADRQRIEQAIATVGLQGFETRPIGTLSGGQMQRTLFARLLVQDAQLILLDEPFSALDTRTTADLIALVQHWHAQGRTVVAVLHDFDMVRSVFPKTLLMARSAVAWGDTSHALCEENLLKARLNSEAWRDDAPSCAA
ncbi:zinc ABC transporter ATP-binding protein AztA [Xanthobacter sp. TB0136]|uniref:zinc ABC transporter ATP-binding protein AztA n=1 Tax=Xanthobacter sp. TB0136 TaxID=3459177 RepID=UPI00403A5920